MVKQVSGDDVLIISNALDIDEYVIPMLPGNNII